MKGLFTQGVAVLFSEAPSLAQLRALLDDYEITSENPLGTSQWQMESASMRIACRPEVNGVCLLDVVSRSWPDHLGSSEREPMLHAAWSLGHFGPFAATGSLARAIEHAHRWEHAEHLALQHVAFVRMRISYCLSTGLEGGGARLPEDYDALPELEWLIKLASHVSKHPRAVAYFNPNGEVVLAPDGLQKVIDEAAQNDAPPLDAIVNVRLAHLDGWQVVDTVGLAQLDLLDQEIVCPDEVSSGADLSAFVFDVAYNMVTTETPIVSDNSTSGPGGTEWVAQERVTSMREPSRTVIHWTEIEGPEEPEHFVFAAVEPEAVAAVEWQNAPAPEFVAVPELPPVFQGAMEPARRPGSGLSGCVMACVIVLIVVAVGVGLGWDELVERYHAYETRGHESVMKLSGWEAQAAAVTSEWQPDSVIDANAQSVPPGSYHTPVGEGKAGSGFVIRYGNSQVFCGVTTLHQFEGRSPSSLDGPAGLKVGLDTVNVLKLRDVQVQLVTEVSRPFECLDYDPSFVLRPGEALLIPCGDGTFMKGTMANSLLIVDQFVSTPGQSQDFTLKLDQPFEFKGFSGSPIIKASTRKVVGVLRSGDDTKTVIGFETLSLGALPQPPKK